MKRILLALAIFVLVLPATRRAEAGVDVSIDFFYNNLNNGGSWVDVGDYGYAWQPDIAVSNRNWRPYTDGYWAYTDVGWTWVSNEDFGWATYHYGRWARVRGQGWVWVPGREWAPAWVSWRTGGDHVGWAPLPPRRGYRADEEVVYQGRSINGYVDIDFDIGPSYYNFVDIRYIGGSGLRSRILPPAQNVTYINNSVNVTNITYNDSRVYNYGPDYERLSAYSTEPIQRLKIQRETNADFAAVAQSNNFSRVQGDTLMIAAPQQLKAAAKTAAPAQVKTKIAQDQLETGWSDVSDEKAKAEMQAKMKKEDRKSIPPPKAQPQNAAAPQGDTTQPTAGTAENAGSATSATTPGATATAAPETDDDKAKGRDKADRKDKKEVQPIPAATVAPTAAPDAEPASTPASDAKAPKADKKKDRDKSPANPSVTDPAVAADAAPAAVPTDGGKQKADKADRKNREKKAEAPAPESAAPTPNASEPAEPAPRAGRGGKKEKASKLPDMQTSERPLRDAPPVKQPELEKAPDSAAEAPAAPARERGNGRSKQKAERREAPAAPEPAAAPQAQMPTAPQPERQAAPPRGPVNAEPMESNRRPAKEKQSKKEKKGEGEAPDPEG